MHWNELQSINSITFEVHHHHQQKLNPNSFVKMHWNELQSIIRVQWNESDIHI